MTTPNEMRQNPLIGVTSENQQRVKVGGGWERYFALLLPGFAVMLVFFVAGMLATSLLVEREAGTLRRLMAARSNVAPSLPGRWALTWCWFAFRPLPVRCRGRRVRNAIG
jgi:hypothetical protein